MNTEQKFVAPSPELKEIMKKFVRTQKEKYGENWKEILAKEMTAQIPKSLMDALTKGASK